MVQYRMPGESYLLLVGHAQMLLLIFMAPSACGLPMQQVYRDCQQIVHRDDTLALAT